MHKCVSRILVLGMVLGVGLVASGQEIVGKNTRHSKFRPHTAEVKTTSVHLLADGTKITREYSFVDISDSEDRTFHETTDPLNPARDCNGNSEPGKNGMVDDPVAGVHFVWESRTRKVRVYKLPEPEQRKGCWLADDGTYRPLWKSIPAQDGTAPKATAVGATASAGSGATQAKPANKAAALRRSASQQIDDDLGTQMIMGVEAQGRRISWITPAGDMGNDQPLVHSSETWYAPSIGLYLRRYDVDPMTGTNNLEVVSLSLDEPSPSVFEIPEGYEVINVALHEVSCAQR
jgi:hypothetical protein